MGLKDWWTELWEDGDEVEGIRKTFKDYFADWDIELPKNVPDKGSIAEAGWTITYVLNEVDGQPCLDFLAEHRMTNLRHIRILSNGEAVAFDTFMEAYGFDPEIDADEDAAKRRYEEHNRRVGDELRAKGLI